MEIPQIRNALSDLSEELDQADFEHEERLTDPRADVKHLRNAVSTLATLLDQTIAHLESRAADLSVRIVE